jgi:hypothetical protein
MIDRSTAVLVLMTVLAASLSAYTLGFLAGAGDAKTVHLRSSCGVADIGKVKPSWYYLAE